VTTRVLRLAFVSLVVLVATGLVVTSGGCSERACFVWKNAQPVCPDALQARRFFGQCNDIATIDGDGSFEADGFCCYSVTKSTLGLPCEPLTQSTGSFGRSSFFSSGAVTEPGSVGTGPANATSSATSGAGGAGGGGVTVTCDMLDDCGFDAGGGCYGCALGAGCFDLAEACATEPVCADFEACFTACAPDDVTCHDACLQMFPDGAAPYLAVLECAVCSSCPRSCGSSPIFSAAGCDAGP
jgi:hypothetical protein